MNSTWRIMIPMTTTQTFSFENFSVDDDFDDIEDDDSFVFGNEEDLDDLEDDYWQSVDDDADDDEL